MVASMETTVNLNIINHIGISAKHKVYVIENCLWSNQWHAELQNIY